LIPSPQQPLGFAGCSKGKLLHQHCVLSLAYQKHEGHTRLKSVLKQSHKHLPLLPTAEDADTFFGFLKLSGCPLMKLKNQSLPALVLLWETLFFVLHCIIARSFHDIVSCHYKSYFTKAKRIETYVNDFNLLTS
jgi:hypothetical protein